MTPAGFYSLERAELFALAPAIALTLAILVARVKAPSPTARSALQHFAAGVVFSTVAVELLPDLTRTHATVEVVVGFAMGVALLLVIRHVTDEPPPAAGGTDAGTRLPVGMLVAVGIDILLDGLLLGLAFALGAKEGLMLTAALALELVSLGLAFGTALAAFRISRALTIAAALAGALLVGAGVGVMLLGSASQHVLAVVLAFGCAALLFLATEELLVEAHESGESAFGTAMFFAGFLIFLIIGMVTRT